jgi:D-glycero-alpha-D-manno-heptose-7-phosphate kinase
VTKKRLGLEAVHVEQNMIREAVGSQDQIAAAFGGLNRINFSRSDNVEVSPLAISGEKQRFLQERLMLFFTGFSRFAVDIEQDKINNLNSRRKELRLLHALVDEAVEVLNGDISGYDAFGHLLHETWLLKRCLSSKVSTTIINEIYDQGMNSGALGGKILGAGGGGFILFYVKPEDRDNLRNSLSHLLHVPFRFETLGTQLIYYTEE